MSVFDRDWFWVDKCTDRMSKFFDNEYNKEKQMFEESWNPIFGQKLTWGAWNGETANKQKLSDWQIYELDNADGTAEPSHFGSSIELKGVATQEEFDKLKEMFINLEDEIIELQGVEEQLQDLKDEIEVLKDNQARLFDKNEGFCKTYEEHCSDQRIKALLEEEYKPKRKSVWERHETNNHKETDEDGWSEEFKKTLKEYSDRKKTYHPETEEPFVNSKDQFTRHKKSTHKAYKTLDEMFEDIEGELDKESNEYRAMKALKDYSLGSNHNETALLSCIKKNINALKQKLVADYLGSGKPKVESLSNQDKIQKELGLTHPSSEKYKNSEGTCLTESIKKKVDNIIANNWISCDDYYPPIDVFVEVKFQDVDETNTLKLHSVGNGVNYWINTKNEIQISHTPTKWRLQVDDAMKLGTSVFMGDQVKHENPHEWISCEKALPKFGVEVEMKYKPSHSKEVFEKGKLRSIGTNYLSNWTLDNDEQNVFVFINKQTSWRPLPESSLVDVLDYDKNDPDFDHIKCCEIGIKTRTGRISNYEEDIKRLSSHKKYLTSKLIEKINNPELKKERDDLYKRIKEGMANYKSIVDKILAGAVPKYKGLPCEKFLLTLKQWVPPYIKICPTKDKESFSKIPPESIGSIEYLYIREANGEVMGDQYVAYYDTSYQDPSTKEHSKYGNVGDKVTLYSAGKELGTCTITGVKQGNTILDTNTGVKIDDEVMVYGTSNPKTDPLKDFSIGDKVIGLSSNGNILFGVIKRFDEDGDIRLNGNYYLAPKRTLKLTQELEQEIVKIIKA